MHGRVLLRRGVPLLKIAGVAMLEEDHALLLLLLQVLRMRRVLQEVHRRGEQPGVSARTGSWVRRVASPCFKKNPTKLLIFFLRQDPEMLEANLDANGGGGGPTISMLLYSIFPAFAVIDLLLGQLAKELGWYSECIAERVCGWSMTACAFWIALTLSGVGVAACTAFSRIAAAARRKGWPCCGDAGDEAGRSAASIGGRSRGPSPQKAGTGNRPYWEAARREGKMATASVGGSTYHLARSGGGGGNSNGGSSSCALLSGNRADSRRSASAPPAEMRRSAARAAGAGGRHHARANVPSIEIVIA